MVLGATSKLLSDRHDSTRGQFCSIRRASVAVQVTCPGPCPPPLIRVSPPPPGSLAWRCSCCRRDTVISNRSVIFCDTTRPLQTRQAGPFQHRFQYQDRTRTLWTLARRCHVQAGHRDPGRGPPEQGRVQGLPARGATRQTLRGVLYTSCIRTGTCLTLIAAD